MNIISDVDQAAESRARSPTRDEGGDARVFVRRRALLRAIRRDHRGDGGVRLARALRLGRGVPGEGLGRPWPHVHAPESSSEPPRGRHVRIEILVDVLPVPAQRALGVAASVIAIGVCVVLTWRTGIAAVEYFRNDIMMPRIWRIPRIWPYAVVPIGSALLACAFVVRLGLYLTDSDPEKTLRARHRRLRPLTSLARGRGVDPHRGVLPRPADADDAQRHAGRARVPHPQHHRALPLSRRRGRVVAAGTET